MTGPVDMSQLTEAQLRRMSAAQIAVAWQRGRLNALLAGKTPQQAAADAHQPGQLTRDDLRQMTVPAIVDALQKGRLRALIEADTTKVPTTPVAG